MKSIIQLDDDRCFMCQSAYGTQWHHIFGKNPQRSYSEQDGLKIRLCADCHCKIHNDPEESGKLQLKYHRLGQSQWEAYYGPKLEAAGKDPREEFIKRYGRNYL